MSVLSEDGKVFFCFWLLHSFKIYIIKKWQERINEEKVGRESWEE
jgi:hypothetical protein